MRPHKGPHRHCGATAYPREFPAFPWTADSRRAISKIVAYGRANPAQLAKVHQISLAAAVHAACAPVSGRRAAPAKHESAMRGATHIAKVHLVSQSKARRLRAAPPRRYTPSVNRRFASGAGSWAERASRRGVAFLSDLSNGSSSAEPFVRPLLISACGAPRERRRVVVGPRSLSE